MRKSQSRSLSGRGIKPQWRRFEASKQQIRQLKRHEKADLLPSHRGNILLELTGEGMKAYQYTEGRHKQGHMKRMRVEHGRHWTGDGLWDDIKDFGKSVFNVVGDVAAWLDEVLPEDIGDPRYAAARKAIKVAEHLSHKIGGGTTEQEKRKIRQLEEQKAKVAAEIAKAEVEYAHKQAKKEAAQLAKETSSKSSHIKYKPTKKKTKSKVSKLKKKLKGRGLLRKARLGRVLNGGSVRKVMGKGVKAHSTKEHKERKPRVHREHKERKEHGSRVKKIHRHHKDEILSHRRKKPEAAEKLDAPIREALMLDGKLDLDDSYASLLGGRSGDLVF